MGRQVKMRSLTISLLCVVPTFGHAESVFVKYRGEVDLRSFDCADITRSSFINRVCYDKRNEYMLISLNGTYYHYCEIDAGTVLSLLKAPSMGQFYNDIIKGAFDCRDHRVPDLGGRTVLPSRTALIVTYRSPVRPVITLERLHFQIAAEQSDIRMTTVPGTRLKSVRFKNAAMAARSL